jgi:hypothetical protein
MPRPSSVEASATVVPGMDGERPSPQAVELPIVATLTALVSLVSLSPKIVRTPIPAQFFVRSSRLLAAAPGRVKGPCLPYAHPELSD